MAKRYRVSHPPTPELSGVREYNFPSNRIQGSNDCIFCGSKTLSYKSVCRKCKYMVSHERLEYLERRRQGQVELMKQEKLEKELQKERRKQERDNATSIVDDTIAVVEMIDIYCMLCFLVIAEGVNNGCVVCNDCLETDKSKKADRDWDEWIYQNPTDDD